MQCTAVRTAPDGEKLTDHRLCSIPSPFRFVSEISFRLYNWRAGASLPSFNGRFFSIIIFLALVDAAHKVRAGFPGRGGVPGHCVNMALGIENEGVFLCTSW